MGMLVGVQFRRAGRLEYFDGGELDPLLDEHVVVQTEKGVDLGTVMVLAAQSESADATPPRGSIVRRATVEDLRLRDLYRAKECDALARCKERVTRHALPMKLLCAEYVFDGSRVTFYFCSESRVDFRDLVRDLAATFRTRIELRQVGPRDETKITGGVARCGRELCCASWLRSFAPVSMRMAKNQDLPLTDNRLSGICGRLMCCLAFENSSYARPPRDPEVATD